MSKTPLRERAIADFDRPAFTESVVVTASGQVVDEPVLLYRAEVYQASSASLAILTIRVNDASGDAKWVLSQYGQGTDKMDFEGLLFQNGIYADHAGSAGTYGSSYEFIRLANITWLRRGMDVPDVMEAFARARTVSEVGPTGVGPPGGGGGGGSPPPSGGGIGPGGGS